MSTMQDAAKATQIIVGALTGVKSAPDYPVADGGAMPYSLCYPSKGTIKITTMDGGRDSDDILTLDFHTGTRANFAGAIKTAADFLDVILDALTSDGNLRGTVSTLDSVDYVLGELLPWEGNIGLRFLLHVTRYTG